MHLNNHIFTVHSNNFLSYSPSVQHRTNRIRQKKEHFLWHFVHTGNSQICHRLRTAYFILFSWKITTFLKNCRNLVGGNKSFQLFFSTNLSIKFIRIEFHNNLSVIISQWEELILCQNFFVHRNWWFGFCCFTSQVNSYGHCGTVSSPNHTFSWAGLNKRLTSNLCTYFRM